MGRNAVTSNELFIDDLRVPVAHRVGEEGTGLQVPARRAQPGADAGRGRGARPRPGRAAARGRATRNERVVFGRPIGMNQGVAVPAGRLAGPARRRRADRCARPTWLYDHGQPCGREANTAKYLCADAGFEAADRALQTHGGMGYAEEYHVARYFREARLLRIAPLSQEMVLNYLGEHVLGLPRSY